MKKSEVLEIIVKANNILVVGPSWREFGYISYSSEDIVVWGNIHAETISEMEEALREEINLVRGALQALRAAKKKVMSRQGGLR